MTLKEAMTADLPVFTNTDEFGVSAVFSRTGESIPVIMDKDIDGETGVLMDTVTLSLSDVPGIQVNDTFVIDGKTYHNASSDPVTIDGLMATFRINT